MDKPVRTCLISPSSYAESSAHLGFQWVWRRLNSHPEVFCDRASLNDRRGVHSGYPLGGMSVLFITMPYEAAFPDLVRMLTHLQIPPLRENRSPKHPLLILGGHSARLIPHLLLSIVDALALGDIELLGNPLLDACARKDREALFKDLQRIDGVICDFPPGPNFYREVNPSFFALEENLPVAAFTTRSSAFPGAFLTEAGRGCPQHCKFCFISHAQGPFHPFPASSILQLPERFPGVDHFGLIGAAVGDHPDMEAILNVFADRGKRVSLSSIKVPFMKDATLQALRRCGETTVTIAPESGAEELRRAMNKPYSDERIVDAVARAGAAGFTRIKTYFLLGLPEEKNEDMAAIGSLLQRMRKSLRPSEKQTGRAVEILVSAAPFVPKPLTPWSEVPMVSAKDIRSRWNTLRGELRTINGVRLQKFEWKEALLQYRLLRASPDEAAALVDEFTRTDPAVARF